MLLTTAGRTGAGATRGGARASTIGLRARISLVAQAVPAGLGQHPQRHRGPGQPRGAGVGQHPHEDLVGVQRAQHHAAAVQQGDELAAGELGRGRAPPRGRHRPGRGGASASAGQRRPAAAPLARRRAAGAPPGSGSGDGPGSARAGSPRPARRSIATCPSTDTTTSLASTSAWVAEPAEQHRRAHRLAQRRHPQVALQLGEWFGERLGDRPRAVDRTARHAPHVGGDRSGLQQPEAVVVADRPTRRPGAGRTRRRRGRPARPAGPGRRGQTRAVVGVVLEDVGVAVEQVARPVHLAAHQRLGSARHGGDHPAVAATGHGIDAEQHPARRRA